MRILIVGAGPSGLTAAVELARRGIVATVIDRRTDASSLSRAVGITPRSLDLLEPSGVSGRLLREGIRIGEVRIHSETKRIASLALSGTGLRHDFLLALAQDRTEAALRDAFADLGGEVTYGVELTGQRRENGRVVVETANGGEAAYDLLIGADGTHSTVRAAAGIGFPGHDLPADWSIADVDAVDWVNAGSMTICLLPHGDVVVVAPLEAARYRVVSNTPDALAALPIPITTTEIRRQARFRISVRQAETYRSGNVFLVGDAAHSHSPVGGRGMNLGIADAADLAGRIAGGDLEGYDAARRMNGAETIAATERARRVVTSGLFFKRPVLFALLKTAGAVPALQRSFARAVLTA